MTPEEKAVIDQAVRWSRTETIGQAEDASEALQDLVAELLRSRETVAPRPEWVPATFGDLMPGDRVRIGTQEADVTKVSRGDWHARNRVWIDDAGRERDHQIPWEHEELNIDFTANPGLHDYDPDVECEILADATRRAAMLVHDVFPGTKPVDS